MKKIFKERPMPDGIEFKEKNYGKTAAVLTAAGGIAAAVGPFAGMTAVSKLDKSFGEDDFVTVLDGAPVTAGGIALDLSPVEADDYLFGCRSGYEVITGAREAFETISARFYPGTCHSSSRLDCIGSAMRMNALILAALASLVILEARSADRNHNVLYKQLAIGSIQI